MIKNISKVLLSALIALGLLVPGFAQKAEAKSKKKVGFFTRIKRKVKRTVKRVAKKTRRAVVKTACGAKNKVVDGAMKAKKAITGKNKSTWVKGHYKKGNKRHTSGHFRYVSHKKKGGSAPAPAPAPVGPSDPMMPQ